MTGETGDCRTEKIEIGTEQGDYAGVAANLADHHGYTRTVVLGYRSSGEGIACLLEQRGQSGVPGRGRSAVTEHLKPDIAEESA
jgi:hypothetical protein